MSWDLRNDMPRLLKAAGNAPSIFNQHPWELELVADDRVNLYSVPNAVLDGRLPRESVISCGAALYNVRLAIQVAGRNPSVWLLPDTDGDSGLLSTVTARRTLVASIEVMAARPNPPTEAEQELYEALWLRRIDSGPFRYLPVPLPILVEMEEAAAHERGWLRTLNKADTRRWLRASAQAISALGDTLPGPVEQIERHPQLMTLSTDDDRPLDWLRAGQALQHALLTGTRFSMSSPSGRSAGYRRQLQYGPLDPHRLNSPPPVPAGYAVEASFLTQYLELADQSNGQRQRAWPWRTNYTEVPQLALRIGYAPAERVGWHAPPPPPPPVAAE